MWRGVWSVYLPEVPQPLRTLLLLYHTLPSPVTTGCPFFARMVDWETFLRTIEGSPTRPLPF